MCRARSGPLAQRLSPESRNLNLVTSTLEFAPAVLGFSLPSEQDLMFSICVRSLEASFDGQHLGVMFASSSRHTMVLAVYQSAPLRKLLGQNERSGCCHRLVEDQPNGNRLCQRLWKRLSEHVVSQWSLTSRFRSAASQSRSSAMASLCDRSKGPVRCRPDFPKLISPSFSVCESLGWHDPGFQLGSTDT